MSNNPMTIHESATLPDWLCNVPADSLEGKLRRVIPASMQEANRWLLHRRKQPYYPTGNARQGALDTPEDTARLGTFEQALTAFQAGDFDGLGFALGAGWQGVDLDKVAVNGLISLVDELPGYVERSPSGHGYHAIGYGQKFTTLAPNSSGVEAYSGKRYFTVTGDAVRGDIECIADFVAQRLIPLHDKHSGSTGQALGQSGAKVAEGGRNHMLTSLAGTMRNRGMEHGSIEAALLSENASRCTPPLADSEVQRIAQSVCRYPVSNDAANDDASGLFAPVVGLIEWPEPLPLPGLPMVPPFDLGLLPDALRPWIADVADRLQVPVDMPAVAAVVALSAAIGRRVQIRPKRLDGWTVIPNLWGMVIAPPGYKKSPALSAVMAPLHTLEREASHDHEAAMATWLMDKERHDVINSAAKSAARERLKKDPAAEVSGLSPDPDEPVARRYVVNNFSLEALAEVNISNPFGVLAFGDELYGLLKMADKPGNEELNSFLLTAWNGDDGFTFDRIGRGRRYVEHVCISVLGGIQPGRLQDYLTNGGIGGAIDSGFLNRFQLMTWPDLPEDYAYIDRAPNRAAESAYQSVFQRVAGVRQFPNLKGPAVANGGPDVRQFDDSAQMVFQDWLEGNERLCRSDTIPPVMTSHLSKFASLVPSLALIFAVADDVQGSIPAHYVHQAIGWAAYLRAHAERVFSCTTRPDTIHAQALLSKIKGGAVKDGFSIRDVYRNEWSLLHREGVEKAIALLCDLDHLLKVEQPPTGKGRPPGAIFRINPKSMG